MFFELGGTDREDIVKAEDKSSSLAMTQEEILAQVGIFLLPLFSRTFLMAFIF